MNEATNKLNFWGNRIYDKVRLMLPTEIFSEMRRGGVTFDDLDRSLKEWQDWRNKTLQINSGGHSQFITYNGHSFVFMVCYKEFCLWSESGAISLGTYGIKNSEPPTNEFIEWLNNTLQNYDQGIVNCSGCGTKMTRSEIAGQYFAGVYCKHCWENKWGDIEAAEDYN